MLAPPKSSPRRRESTLFSSSVSSIMPSHAAVPSHSAWSVNSTSPRVLLIVRYVLLFYRIFNALKKGVAGNLSKFSCQFACDGSDFLLAASQTNVRPQCCDDDHLLPSDHSLWLKSKDLASIFSTDLTVGRWRI